MNINPTKAIAGAIVLTGASISGYKAFNDMKDGKPDSVMGYLGYGIAAGFGAMMLGSVVPGTIGKGIASAGIITAILGGGAIGAAIGSATND